MSYTELFYPSTSGQIHLYKEAIGVATVVLNDANGIAGLPIIPDVSIAFSIRVTSTVVVPGSGGLVVGDSYSEFFNGAVKNVSGTTALVGAVTAVDTFSNTNMLTTAVAVVANNTSDLLQVEYTPSTLADVETVIVISATINYTSA